MAHDLVAGEGRQAAEVIDHAVAAGVVLDARHPLLPFGRRIRRKEPADVRGFQEAGERGRVLDGERRALREEGQDRVGGIAEKRDAPLR